MIFVILAILFLLYFAGAVVYALRVVFAVAGRGVLHCDLWMVFLMALGIGMVSWPSDLWFVFCRGRIEK